MQRINKKKQIEEMTKDLEEYVSYDEWNAREYGEYTVDCSYTAYKLIEQGWVKPDKDSVVLSREGYDILIAVENERIKQARKETVREIFYFVGDRYNSETLMLQLENFIAEKYEVKVE